MGLSGGSDAPRLALLVIATLAIVATTAGACGESDAGGLPSGDTSVSAVRSGDAALAEAFGDRASDLEVEGAGTVVRLLADDQEGSRHQRFILRLASGQTLLVAHNIDIAPRIEDLKGGDTVAFHGVYEWNAAGGTIHWTHGDPGGQHASGWLRHDGIVYR